MKIKLLALLIPFLLSASLHGQNGIDYSHKSIKKALSKSGIIDISNIIELTNSSLNVSINNNYGKFFLIEAPNAFDYRCIFIGRVYCCRSNGCNYPSKSLSSESSEYFDYFIIYDKTNAIKKISVFNYQATYGHEITAKGWLKQFVGYSGKKLFRIDKEIDAISGATISANAIISDVVLRTKLLQDINLK